MKVICISNHMEHRPDRPKYDYLTIGSVYEIIPTMRSKAITYMDWLIKDDSSNASWYPKSLFVSLQEYRQAKLEQILI